MLLRRLKLQMVSESVEDYEIIKSRRRLGGVKIQSSNDVFELFSYLSGFPQEEVHALYLDGRDNLLGTYMVSRGTNNSSLLSPSDVVRPGLLVNAISIILVHNHPSGSLEPSEEDLLITKRVFIACSIFDLKLSDHVIIAGGSFRSIISEVKRMKNLEVIWRD